jgi:NADH-quinone oxidoreductase subunit L
MLILFRKPLGKAAGVIASAAIGGSFYFSLVAFGDLVQRPAAQRLSVRLVYDWVSVGGFRAPLEFRVDPLTVVMLLVVTGVGSLIHVYSIGYMAGDPRRATFFAYLNLFAGSMLILVLANNFLVLYAGWELVGLCSYLLISFWYFKPSAAAAGKKAFIVNRIGDFGLLIGIFLIYRTFGSLSFDRVFSGGGASGALATAIPLLLLIGACGKSAQLPLYVWLPDAMEGPTPVSALIHAATMVTAGVYLVARAHVLFEVSHFASTTVAVVGAATALFAATIAVTQDDIKRVLAYSTISQIGYMFMAVGIGATGYRIAYVAGIFHLVTHAFFKALLFLGAGSVMHATGEVTDMKKMGGLWKALPATSSTFIVGWLAIAGVPPLAGFFSKDLILAGAFSSGHRILWAVGLATAGITAFYMSRQVFLTFFGKSRLAPEVHPHESPGVMTIPLQALALLAVAGGIIGAGAGGGRLARFLAPVFEGGAPAHEAGGSETALAVVAVTVALTGIAAAFALYLARGAEERRERVKSRLGGLVTLVRNKYYVDEAYGALFVLPAKKLAQAAAYGFDTHVIDGAVNGVGLVVRNASAAMRRFQTGFVRRYVVAMMSGVVVLVAFLVVRGR